MLNTKEINKISRAISRMDLGGKIAALITLVGNLHDVMLNHCVSKAGLAIGTTDPAKVKIVNTTTYVVNGVLLSKTTAEVAFTATTHNIPANAQSVQEAVFLLSLDVNGNPTLTMGTIVTGAGNAQVPLPPAGNTEIGMVRIAVAAGATSFTATSTQLSNGALTVTYTDLLFRPSDLAASVAAITS